MHNHLRKTRQAKVALNLLRLGHNADDIADMVKHWVVLSHQKTGAEIDFLLSNLQKPSDDELYKTNGHLILSVHYGFYPALYLLLAESAHDQRVAAIIGDQPDEHANALMTLARQHGVHIDFIRSGPRIIREAREYIRGGRSAVLLVDVPWSAGDAPFDLWHPGYGGAFASRKTLERFAGIVDESAISLFAWHDGGQHRIGRAVGPSWSSCFDTLARLLAENPCQYERLDSFDNHYRFNNNPQLAILFTVGLGHYCMHSPSGRSWDITAAIEAAHLAAPVQGRLGQSQLNGLARIIGQAIDVAIAI